MGIGRQDKNGKEIKNKDVVLVTKGIGSRSGVITEVNGHWVVQSTIAGSLIGVDRVTFELADLKDEDIEVLGNASEYFDKGSIVGFSEELKEKLSNQHGKKRPLR